MQIAQTQPQTLMLSQYVAQSAHQALLSKHPASEAPAVAAISAKPVRSSVNPTNSLDILV